MYGSVNLRKSYSCKSVIKHIGTSKAANQTKRYRLFSLYLYFLGLSYRNTAKALNRFVHRSHVAIWKWIQRYKPEIFKQEKKDHGYIVDETQIKVGSQYIWLLWVAIEPKHKEILQIDISFERTMLLVAESFISSLINRYGKHSVSTDGGTWYPQACKFLKLYFLT